MRSSLALLFLLVACGGKVDDASQPATAGAHPNNASSDDACTRACARFDRCLGAWDARDTCVSTCAQEFTDVASARRYADCIAALSCEDIRVGMTMDYGPIGACYAKARGR